MGTVTEEIISESDREAVGEGGAGAWGNSGFVWPSLGLRGQCGKITGMQTKSDREHEMKKGSRMEAEGKEEKAEVVFIYLKIIEGE